MSQTKDYHENYLYVLIFGLSIFLFARDVMLISINKYFLLLFVLMYMFVSNRTYMIYGLVFLFPLLNGLPNTYILLGAIVILIFKEKRLALIPLALTVYFALLEFLASFWYPTSSVIIILRYLATLFWFFYLLYVNEEIEYNKCLRIYLIGTCLYCFIVLISCIKTAPTNWITLFSNGLYRFGDVNRYNAGANDADMMIGNNPNELAYFSLIGICVALLLYYREKKNTIVRSVGLTVIVFSGFMSASRTWVIMVIFILLLFFLLLFKGHGKGIIPIIIGGAIVAIAANYILNKYPTLLGGYQTRFMSDTTMTGGHRTELFYRYWVSFFSQPRCWITGTGVTDYWDITGIYNSIHNMFQQIIICFGFPSAAVFLIAILKPLFKSKNVALINYIPVIGVLTFTQTIQFVNPYTLMLPYVVGIYALQNQNAEKI